MPNDPSELLRQAHAYAERYVAGARDRRAFPDAASIAALAELDGPLPDGPSDPETVLAQLDRVGSPATAAQTGGRYFGFVTGGSLPVGLAARWLGDAWDQNTAVSAMSPVANKLEELCERWVAELLGLPAGTAAGFVTGTTLANVCALAAARGELLARQGWNVAEAGLYGAPPIRLILGADAHAAVKKALALLGLGTERAEIVPVDDQGRMRLDRFPELDGEALVVTQAGNVNSGAFDPIGEVCERVHAAGGWVHVDGAFGLWAGASPSLASLYGGIEQADSWAADAHKTLNVPYDCGVVLCRHRAALVAALGATAAYLEPGAERDGMCYTPSMSKRARAVELWAVLRTLGRSGVAELVDRLCALARLFAERLRAEGFDVLNEVCFNQVLASCGDDHETTRTLAEVQASGECWCGGSVWRGRQVIRVSVCSWATTEEDVERSVRAFVAARERARAAAR
ncbi:MAG: aminotransferase class V-fold PLP-dependent enzyme [Planctomycetota bacterium]